MKGRERKEDWNVIWVGTSSDSREVPLRQSDGLLHRVLAQKNIALIYASKESKY